MAKFTSIWYGPQHTVHCNWCIFQIDVTFIFLNGHLMEEVYVEQPLSFEISGQEVMVYRLKKVLYGLKQAPKA